MKKALIGEKSFDVEGHNDDLIINGERLAFDLEQIYERQFHILLENKSYRVQVVSIDKSHKSVSIRVNGNSYTVKIKSDLDLLLEKLGMDSNGQSGSKEVKAPMPGLILEVLVENGQEVKKGDQLLILEAMKMENVIKSPSDGVVNDLKAIKGDSVEKGKFLLSL